VTRALATLFVLALGLGCAKKPSPPPCLPEAAPRAGKATYYDATGSGSCSFPAFAAGDDRMVVALNGPDWDRAAWCGGCLRDRRSGARPRPGDLARGAVPRRRPDPVPDQGEVQRVVARDPGREPPLSDHEARGAGRRRHVATGRDARLGAGPFTLRVTDSRGHALVDEGIALAAGAVVAGKAQFPACP
jgi:hypothetical protein